MKHFLALTTVFALALALYAAPVPRQKMDVDSNLLNDTKWDYQYGQQEGWIRFYNNGFYFARHGKDDTPTHCGEWYTDTRGNIQLNETSFSPHCGPGTYRTKWHFDVNTKKWPSLEGVAYASDPKNSTYLKLSNRQYFGDNK